MKRKIVPAIICAVMLCSSAQAQTKIYDSVAIQLLDRMASILGDIGSCSFTVNESEDKDDFEYGMVTRFSSHDVTFSGNNKLLVLSKNDEGRAGYWFNGNQLNYYNFTRNHYGTLDHPGSTTMEAIDFVHEAYDVNFPAADFFYPTFTDDLIAMATRIEYMGKSEINGEMCYRIAARGPKALFQLWLSEDGYTLPVKAIYKDLGKTNSHYEASFSNWKINPDVPDALFDFTVPPEATPITIVPKTK